MRSHPGAQEWPPFQRGEPPQDLAAQAEWFPARREDRQGGGAHEEGLGQPRARLDHVLAVVQDQQAAVIADAVDDRVEDRPVGFLGDPETTGDRELEALSVRDGRQVDEGCAAGEPLSNPRRDLQCEARLAGAAHPGDRDQALGGQELADRLQLVEPADERRGDRRLVVNGRDLPPRRARGRTGASTFQALELAR